MCFMGFNDPVKCLVEIDDIARPWCVYPLTQLYRTLVFFVQPGVGSGVDFGQVIFGLIVQKNSSYSSRMSFFWLDFRKRGYFPF